MRPILLLLLVGSLAAVGCGSDSSSDTLSSSELKTKASAICKQVVADQQKAADAKDYGSIPDISDKAISDLEALEPSDADKAKYEAYVTAQKAAVEASNPVAEALDAGDQAKAQQLATSAQTLSDTANKAATAAGLPECAG